MRSSARVLLCLTGLGKRLSLLLLGLGSSGFSLRWIALRFPLPACSSLLDFLHFSSLAHFHVGLVLGLAPALAALFCLRPQFSLAWPFSFLVSQLVICHRPCSAIAPWNLAASHGDRLAFHALPCVGTGSSLLLAACLITTSVALG